MYDHYKMSADQPSAVIEQNIRDLARHYIAPPSKGPVDPLDARFAGSYEAIFAQHAALLAEGRANLRIALAREAIVAPSADPD